MLVELHVSVHHGNAIAPNASDTVLMGAFAEGTGMQWKSLSCCPDQQIFMASRLLLLEILTF